MGLSSSQARLLSLTGRMHDIEYKAARLEAQKLQMANESDRVYGEYLNALDASKIQIKQLATDGSIDFIDATVNNLIDNGYYIQFANNTNQYYSKAGVSTADGTLQITQADKNLYDTANGNRDYFLALKSGRVTTSNTTVGGVYEIYTAQQLVNMPANQNCRLMADIDMSSITNYSSKSLGTNCTFDGNGHSITGLTKTLFSNLGTGSTVKNLSLNGSTSDCALLTKQISNSNVTIQNIRLSGNIDTSASYAGSLTGRITGSNVKIENCASETNITNSNAGGTVGGLIGQVLTTTSSPTTITNCSTKGSLSGYTYMGGLIGEGQYLTATNCSSDCNVTSNRTYIEETTHNWDNDISVGGFIGSCAGTTNISNCKSSGTVSTNCTVVGGFAGVTHVNTTISNCSTTSSVTGKGYLVGGFVGATNGGSINNSDATGSVTNNFQDANNAGFVGGNGDPTTNTACFTNCYTNKEHFYSKDSGLTITQSSTPNNNVITVTPPNISVGITVESDSNYDSSYLDIYNHIRDGKYIIDSGEASPAAGYEDSSSFLKNMIAEAQIFLFKKDNNDELYQVSVSTDTNLQEVQDETLLKKAEAKYEADMKRIDRKDAKYDTDLAALDTERNAIKQEMETLKTVAKENVERTFKLFS